jgi:hypothetical protein
MPKKITTTRTVQLPATLEEAEAIQYARDMLAGFAKGNPWSQDSALSPEGSRVFIREFGRTLLGNVVGRYAIIQAAKAGDPDCIKIMQAVLIEMKSRQIELPLEVKEYDLWCTVHGEPRPHRVSQQRNYVLRDICLFITIAAVVDHFALPPTGRSARKRSACSIVAEALDAVNSVRAYKTLERIWLKYRHAQPPIGWTWTLEETAEIT